MNVSNPNKHYELILKAKRNNAYFYVEAFKAAKRNLSKEEFIILQSKLAKVA